MRFYQTLSLGRIPVLLNTDMEFPFENEIKWQNIIITAKTEKELVKHVIHFWESKTEIDIENIQQECKNIYEAYFKPSAFGLKLTELLFKHKAIDFPYDKPTSYWKSWLKKIT